MGAVITKPVVVEVPTGRDIIVVVEGKPVIVLRHKETRESTDLHGSTYAKHEYVGMGLSIREPNNYNYQYVGECANTLSLPINEQTIDGVVAGIQERYYKK